MDLMISLGQKNTLAEYMILFGSDNRPPMLDKDLCDSWKSRMELYMQNREHGRMILESVEHGPLIWPTVEEKYAELSAAEKIQADYDMKATNIILQGLPTDIYSLMNHHRVAKDLWERVQLLMQVAYQSPQALTQLMTESPFIDLGFAILVFSPRDDLIACLNKARAFLTAVASSRFPTINNQLRTSSNPRNQSTIQDGRVTVQQVQGRQWQNYSGNTYKSNVTSSRENTTSGQARVVKCYNCQGEGHMARQCTQRKRPRNTAWYNEKEMLAEAQEAVQILDEEQLAFLADLGIPVPNSETYLNDMDNQSVHALQDFEQSPLMDFIDNEISSDSNIIPYSQYLQEAQQATVQYTNLQAQQDSMILCVIEQMLEQMINHVNNWEKANKEQNN
ncbi:integrase, catalytic region, zinc finger, CCHC-type containing protein [Tanacetum coccineum]